MATVGELLRAGGDLPGESPGRDTEILLGHCLGVTRSWLYTWPEREVCDNSARRFRALLDRRRKGSPVAYLTGEREFWSLRLAVDEATLIPRPETEALVAWALELSLPARAETLDLGTGSGAIALALASERPDWRVTGIDASADALRVAAANAVATGLDRVTFLESDWFAALAGRVFDLVVANPPYIDAGDPHLQCGDLRFEPRSALVAGSGGLAALAAIIATAPACLRPGAWLLLEHGCAQGDSVRRLLRAAGFAAVSTRRDLAGLERVSGGRWRAE